MSTTLTTTYSPKLLKEDILVEARSIGLAAGFAEAIAEAVTKDITAWLKDKPTITTRSLNHKVAALIKKYHSDLAYLYENRGKII